MNNTNTVNAAKTICELKCDEAREASRRNGWVSYVMQVGPNDFNIDLDNPKGGILIARYMNGKFFRDAESE